MAIALVVAACGGSSDDGGSGDTEPDQPDATQPAPDDDDSNDAPPATEGSDDGGSSGGEGPSTATVTLDGETYEFSSEGVVPGICNPDLFGIFAVVMAMANGGDGSLNLEILHEGTDPEVVEVTTKAVVKIGDVHWVADPEDLRIVDNPDVTEGQSQVESVEINGNSVSGTASFAGSQTVFSADFVEFATGTFEATCNEG